MRFLPLLLLIAFSAEVTFSAPKKIAAPAKKTTALVPCAEAMKALVLPAEKFNGENTVMRGQFSQMPQAPVIPREYLGDTHRVTGAPGDPLFPNVSGDAASIQLRTGTDAPRAANLIANSAPARPLASLSSSEKLKLAENYVRELYADTPLDAKVIQTITKATAEDPRLLAPALKQYETGALSLEAPRSGSVATTGGNSREVVSGRGGISQEAALAVRTQNRARNELSSESENRHFWFTPQGETKAVPARVLDLHVNNKGEAQIYAEWVPQRSDGGERVRHVGMINLNEVKSIPPLSAQLRLDAAAVFFESLTPNQISTQMLASRLGIKPRGHTDFLRAPGVTGEAKSITDKMSVQGHHAVRAWVEKQFGDISDLLTPAEKANSNWNAMDVFGRLSPEYVLKRFRASGGAKYMYVITEDGQLKVSPLGDASTNLRPQLLRLGHGRKIFSAGTFTLDDNGAVDLTLRTADYVSFDSQVVGSVRSPENEHKLARAIFRMQADADVKTVNAASPDSWSDMRMNFRSGQYEHVNPIDPPPSQNTRSGTSGSQSDRNSEWGDQATADYMDSLLKARAKPAAIKDWDRGNAKAVPPSFEEWQKTARGESSNFNQLENKIDYAHYILGTTDKMEIRVIKAAYQKLMAVFAVRESSEGMKGVLASQRINDAYKVFKDIELEAARKRMAEQEAANR